MKFVHTGKRIYRLDEPSRAVLDYLRSSVPSTHRFCDESGTWYVYLKYVVPLGQIQLSKNGTLILSELPDYEKQQLEEYANKLVTKKSKTTLGSDAHSILHLLPSAPRLIVDAVWRALAKIHHPDKGGDKEAFQKYQAAYDKITKGS